MGKILSTLIISVIMLCICAVPAVTPALADVDITEEEGTQTIHTFESLGYDTSTFHDGDTLLLEFDNPYTESTALLDLHKVAEEATTSDTGVIDLQVAAGECDTYTSKNWSVFCDDERIMRLGYHSICGRCSGFLRFPGISGLEGATISEAYVEIYQNCGVGNASLVLSAEDAADPAQVTWYYDHRTRPRTETCIEWTGTMSGTWNRSPSLVPVIQELVDKYDPAGIQIFLDDDGVTPVGNSWEILTWEYGAHDRGAKLHIEYELDGGGETASCSEEDCAQLYINDTYLADAPFADSGEQLVEVPAGVMVQGSNTIRLEFAGTGAKTVLDDSSINITEETL